MAPVTDTRVYFRVRDYSKSSDERVVRFDYSGGSWSETASYKVEDDLGIDSDVTTKWFGVIGTSLWWGAFYKTDAGVLKINFYDVVNDSLLSTETISGDDIADTQDRDRFIAEGKRFLVQVKDGGVDYLRVYEYFEGTLTQLASKTESDTNERYFSLSGNDEVYVYESDNDKLHRLLISENLANEVEINADVNSFTVNAYVENAHCFYGGFVLSQGFSFVRHRTVLDTQSIRFRVQNIISEYVNQLVRFSANVDIDTVKFVVPLQPPLYPVLENVDLVYLKDYLSLPEDDDYAALLGAGGVSAYRLHPNEKLSRVGNHPYPFDPASIAISDLMKVVMGSIGISKHHLLLNHLEFKSSILSWIRKVFIEGTSLFVNGIDLNEVSFAYDEKGPQPLTFPELWDLDTFTKTKTIYFTPGHIEIEHTAIRFRVNIETTPRDDGKFMRMSVPLTSEQDLLVKVRVPLADSRIIRVRVVVKDDNYIKCSAVVRSSFIGGNRTGSDQGNEWHIQYTSNFCRMQVPLDESNILRMKAEVVMTTEYSLRMTPVLKHPFGDPKADTVRVRIRFPHDHIHDTAKLRFRVTVNAVTTTVGERNKRVWAKPNQVQVIMFISYLRWTEMENFYNHGLQVFLPLMRGKKLIIITINLFLVLGY
jgi:hypothetical protein